MLRSCVRDAAVPLFFALTRRLSRFCRPSTVPASSVHALSLQYLIATRKKHMYLLRGIIFFISSSFSDQLHLQSQKKNIQSGRRAPTLSPSSSQGLGNCTTLRAPLDRLSAAHTGHKLCCNCTLKRGGRLEFGGEEIFLFLKFAAICSSGEQNLRELRLHTRNL